MVSGKKSNLIPNIENEHTDSKSRLKDKKNDKISKKELKKSNEFIS